MEEHRAVQPDRSQLRMWPFPFPAFSALHRYTTRVEFGNSNPYQPINDNERHDILLYVKDVKKGMEAQNAVAAAYQDLVNNIPDANAMNNNGGKLRANGAAHEFIDDYNRTIQALQLVSRERFAIREENIGHLSALMGPNLAREFGDMVAFPLFRDSYPTWLRTRIRSMWETLIETDYFRILTENDRRGIKQVNCIIHSADLVGDTLALRCRGVYCYDFTRQGLIDDIFEVRYYLRPDEAEALRKSPASICTRASCAPDVACSHG